MAQSKKRKSQQHSHLDYIPHKRKRKSAIPVAVIFCALIGLGIAWFAAGAFAIPLLAGVIIGGVIGFFAGTQMDKSFGKP